MVNMSCIIYKLVVSLILSVPDEDIVRNVGVKFVFLDCVSIYLSSIFQFVKMNNHLSGGGNGELGPQEREFDRRRKVTSCINRRRFLRSCLEEQVLPRSAPKQLSDNINPFTESARKYLQEACENL